MMHVIIPASLMLAAAPSITHAQAADDTIPGAALLADVAVLRDAYETLHPGLYRYATPAQVRARFRALEERVRGGRTLAQAYVDLAEFTAAIRCGHTYPNFFNQKDSVAAVLLQRDRIPFLFQWMNGRMIVTRDLGAGLPPGTEVRAINGTPSGQILRRLLPLSRADGSNDAKRVANLEVRGDSRYEAFDVYFPLVFPPPPGEWTLSVVRPGRAAPETMRVRPMTYAARVAAIERIRTVAPEDGPAWEFRWIEPTTGYLRMPTWALYDSKWQWKPWLDNVFRELNGRGGSSLVIDLRGNEGGLDVGDEILAHLTPRDLPQAQYRRRVRYRAIPPRLRPYLDTWDRSFDDWGSGARDLRGGFYSLTRYDDTPDGNVIRPAAPRFAGRVYALVGASNSSATFQFAEAARRSGLVTLVGQPTGGNQRGINGGAFYFLRLPHSRIEVDLPLIGYFPVDERPDAGIAPDVSVAPSSADVAAGVDTELRATLARIHRARGTRN